MGRGHIGQLKDVKNVKLTAIADGVQANIDLVLKDHPDIKTFSSAEELVKSGEVDAILIATPHYFHPELAILGLENGLHVLVEKPVAVTAKAAAEMNAVAAKYPNLKFSAMFQMRTNPKWAKIKQLIEDGMLGEIRRIQWTATKWYRPQAYYASGGWRATWKGEGGGVLLNQCPHNIDLLYWLLGLPSSISAQIALGKHHNIEVEDEVIATLTYPNGAVGVFIASTSELPGTDYTEIVGDKGKITTSDSPNDQFIWEDFGKSIRTLTFNTPDAWPKTDTIKSVVTAGGEAKHSKIHQNFVNAILNDEPLIASAVEGIHSVEIANAMIMSGIQGKPVSLPTDHDAYEALLAKLIAESDARKK
jgi:predicted dehydrogenase